jgi:hypothetical protein
MFESPIKFKVEMDPLHKYPHLDPDDMMESLGVLPIWARDKRPQESYEDCFKRCYDFWIGDIGGETEIAEDGTYSYPDDPDMFPVMRMWDEKEEVFFYPHALVAIRTIGSEYPAFVTRMD